MLALDISPISYSEFNLLCICLMVAVVIYANNFLKSIQLQLSRFMGVLAVLYSTALFCDAIRYKFDISGWPSERLAAILIDIYCICLLFAAASWCMYTVSKLHPMPKRRYLLYGGITLPADLMLLYSIALFFVDRSYLDESGHMLIPNGWLITQRATCVLYYVLSIIMAVSCVVRRESKKKNTAVLIASFPLPYIAFLMLEVITWKNFEAIGIMLSFTFYVFVAATVRAKSQSKELSHFANIMDSMKNQYSSILYANIKTNQVEPYVINEALEVNGKHMEGIAEYDLTMKEYAENVVYSSDVEKYLENTDRNRLAEVLKSNDKVTFEYRIVVGGEIRYLKLEAWRAKDDVDSAHVVMGYIDITDRKVRARQDDRKNSIIQGLVKSFEYVCYLNYGNADFEEYYVSKRFDYFFDAIGENDGFKRFVSIFKHGMDKKEYDAFRERFEQNTILEEILENGTYSTEVVLNLGTGKRHYTVTAIGQESNPEVAIFGVADIDDQVKAEIERKERIKEKEYSIQLEKTISERTAELHEKAKSLNQINEDITELLGNITEARDVESGTHIKRVKGYTRILANHIKDEYPEYGLDDEQILLITSASALHDIGKIMIPDSILRKPGRFTPEEFDVMKSHCMKGCEILEMAPKGWDKRYLDFSMEICKYHHEKWNGKGYPEGLKGDEIPISAQIVSVADCFDALTTKRVYKDAYAPEEAFKMITSGECGEFSEKIITAFRNAKEEFYEYFDGGQPVEQPVFTPVATKALKDVSILVVEDNELTRNITEEILENEGAIVTALATGTEALELLEKSNKIEYDAILMDLSLPEIDGFETTRRIRNMDTARAKVVPIIAVTSSTDRQDMQRAFDEKMSAYMPKPISVSNLTRILLSSMRSEQKSLENRLDEAVMRANKDALTGVKNMTAYTETIGEITQKIANKDDIEFAMVMCDVNKLKSVNDTFGHDCGDRYIRNCCQLICQTYSHSPVYRIGGDEFAVILTGQDYENRNELIDELGGRIAAASKIDRIEDGMAKMAVGMSVFNPYSDFSVASVAKRADESMYTNKRMMEFGGQY